MLSVAIEVQTECGTCRLPMPVNTLAAEVSCPSCGRPTAISTGLWKALLREPMYDGPRMLPNEGRRASADKLSLSYIRRGPCCHGCKQAIPLASITEVQDEAALRCDRCAEPTRVRAVPAALAGALPNITHLVGEDPDPLAGATASPAEAATLLCPQCGSPVPFDGVTRAVTCRFCSASVHVPDNFIYRGKRRVVAPWFLCFHPSISDGAPATQAIAAGLFDWTEPPVAAVDADGNLYCAATQAHWVATKDGGFTQGIDHVLWSVDPSLNVRWVQRGVSKPRHLALSPRGRLLLIGWGRATNAWFSCQTGERNGSVYSDRLECEDLTCDREGFLLILTDQALRRVSPEGSEVRTWPGGASRSKPSMSPRELPDYPAEMNTEASMRVHCGPDGSIYLMGLDEIARFDADGRKIYGVKLPAEAADSRYRTLGADRLGNIYVLCSKKLVSLSPTGEARVILESNRDALPRSEMSIAACPDGAFWLFGKGGLAWEFDASGALLFASEKEPRPRKPTAQEVMQRQTEGRMAQAMAEAREAQERVNEREEIEFERRRRIGLLMLMGIVILMMLLFVFSMRHVR